MDIRTRDERGNLKSAEELEAIAEYLKTWVEDLKARLIFVLARTKVEDDIYTFPDGESWDAGSLA